MKKIIGILLLCALVLSIAGCDNAQSPVENPEGDDAREFNDPGLGIRFILPEAWYKGIHETGSIIPSGYGNGFSLDYLPSASREKMAALTEELQANPPSEGQYTEEQMQILDEVLASAIPFVGFLVEDGGQNDAEMRSIFSEEQPLGEKGGSVYTLLTNSKADLSALPKADQAEFLELTNAAAEVKNTLELSGKRSIGDTEKVVFDSETLSGEKIDSSVFSNYNLTMINLWATWCGPCVEEMPLLQVLYENIPEDINLLGVCLDGKDEAEMAKQIVEESGVTYQSVVANAEMENGFMAGIQGYPTTIFVDSEGNIVGDPIIGVPTGDAMQAYLDAINERLALLGF